jgi:hypothetical protein
VSVAAAAATAGVSRHRVTFLFFSLPLPDTDSILLGAETETLCQLLRPKYAAKWDRIKSFLFEDPTSPLQQSGLLKVSEETLHHDLGSDDGTHTHFPCLFTQV